MGTGNMKLERGSAGITIELHNATITVRHQSDETILFRCTAIEGDWNRLWDCLRSLGIDDAQRIDNT